MQLKQSFLSDEVVLDGQQNETLKQRLLLTFRKKLTQLPPEVHLVETPY